MSGSSRVFEFPRINGVFLVSFGIQMPNLDISHRANGRKVGCDCLSALIGMDFGISRFRSGINGFIWIDLSRSSQYRHGLDTRIAMDLGSKGYYGSDLWRFWISQSLLWISCEDFPRSDCASSMVVGICLFNFEIRYQDKETTVVSSLRRLFGLWLLKGFTVLLVFLRSDLGESDYISSICEGNQFGYGWFNGLIGLDLQIVRLGVSFLGILKESYCKIEGDICVLSRFQSTKQTRANRGLQEDSRLLMVLIMVGVSMRSTLEIVDIGCLRDLWKLFQLWFSLVSLIRCVFFGGNHLLVLSGFMFVPPIYFLGCNGVLVSYLNNNMVSSCFFESLCLYVGEIVKQGNFWYLWWVISRVSLQYGLKGISAFRKMAQRLKSSHHWFWLMMGKTREYIYWALFGFLGLWFVAPRAPLWLDMKLLSFFSFGHLQVWKWRPRGLLFQILGPICLLLNLEYGFNFEAILNHINRNDDLASLMPNFLFVTSLFWNIGLHGYETLRSETMTFVILMYRGFAISYVLVVVKEHIFNMVNKIFSVKRLRKELKVLSDYGLRERFLYKIKNQWTHKEPKSVVNWKRQITRRGLQICFRPSQRTEKTILSGEQPLQSRNNK